MSVASADLLYQVLARALNLSVWGGVLVGAENLPRSGPAVFVCNHVGALGPIAVAASLPVRLYPWIVPDMLDLDLAGAYLQMDFVEPELHLPTRIAVPAARALSLVTIRLLRGIGCIPAWHDKRVVETYRLTTDYLAIGRSIAVFPEDPTQPAEARSGMKPFKTGFARLGQLHFERTRERLRFYPVAIVKSERQVRLAPAIEFNPLHRAAEERIRMARLLESTIHRLLAGNQTPVYAGVLPTR